MTSINISELTYSYIAEIDMNDISSIKGGSPTLGIIPDILNSVPELEALEVLVLTENVLNEIDSMSFNNIRGLFNLVQVVPTNTAPVTNSQIPIRRFPF